MAEVRPSEGWMEKLCTALLAVAVSLYLLAMFEGSFFLYMNWSDRDLMRSANLGENFLTTGAELSYGYGAKLPGGAFHYVMAIPLMLASEPLYVFRFQVMLLGLAALLLAFTVHELPRWARVLAVAIFVAMPITTDTTFRLWNPGFLPAFIGVGYFAMARFVDARQVGSIVLVAAAIGLGAQMHMSAVLLMLVMVPGLWLWGPKVTGRSALLAIAAFTATYAPHIVDELLNGLPNTRLLANQTVAVEIQRGTPDGLFRAYNVESLGRWLWTQVSTGPSMPEPDSALYTPALAFANLSLLFGAAGLLFSTRKETPASLRVVALGLPLAIVYFGTHGSIDLRGGAAGRYLLVFAPGLALIAALGASRLASSLDRTVAGNAVRALATAGALVGLANATAATSVARAQPNTYHLYLDVLHDVSTHLGISEAEVAGRTLILKDNDRYWSWRAADSVDYLLARQNATTPGALPPPCVAVLPYAPDELQVDGAFLREVLAQEIEELHVTGSFRVGRHRAVTYEVPGRPCHSSMAQRYLLTEPEEAIAPFYDTWEVGQAHDLPSAGNRRRLGILLSADETIRKTTPPIVALVLDFASDADIVEVTMNSNQLRGQGFNAGYFESATLGDPTLIFTSTDGYDTPLTLVEGWVGNRGVFPPLTASTPLAGTPPFQVRLETDIIEAPNPQRDPKGPRRKEHHSYDLLQAYTPGVDPTGR